MGKAFKRKIVLKISGYEIDFLGLEQKEHLNKNRHASINRLSYYKFT